MEIIEYQNCYFHNPYYFDVATKQILPWDGNGTQYWEFGEMTCSTTIKTTELIENASTGAEFYLDKSINYGDSLIIFFLLLFAVFGIIKMLSDWFIPKKIDFRK